jgi:hypothetical protein
MRVGRVVDEAEEEVGVERGLPLTTCIVEFTIQRISVLRIKTALSSSPTLFRSLRAFHLYQILLMTDLELSLGPRPTT